LAIDVQILTFVSWFALAKALRLSVGNLAGKL